MADQKLTALTTTTVLAGADLLYSVRDTGGTPVSRGIAFSNVISYMMSRPGELFGGYISPSVASNNLTLAVKTNAGNDPSATEPVFVNIGGTIRAITAATSTTKNAGTNWGAAGGSAFAAKSVDWFAYVVWDSNSSVVAISASRWPGGVLVSDFSSTSTNERYLFDYTNYTATDNVEVCGRFSALLSAAASYNWSLPTASPLTVVKYPTRISQPMNYTPTISAGYSVNPSNAVYQYIMDDRLCKVCYREATAGTSNTTGAAVYTAPFTAATLTNGAWASAVVGTDNAAIFVGYSTIGSAASTISINKPPNFTNTGDRRVNVMAELCYPTGA